MRRFMMYLQMYKMPIIIVSALLILVVFSVIGLNSMESFYRNITLAQLPIQIFMGIIHAGVFVFMYTILLRGGFAKFDKAPIKGKGVDITWKDVIGMEDAKQEAWEFVQLIRERTNLMRIGGKAIKGLLMVGPPGCGKT